MNSTDPSLLAEAWATGAQGDLAAEAHLLAAATRYDAAHPGEDSLVAELCAATAGDPLGVAA